jgi:hypothetical protein
MRPLSSQHGSPAAIGKEAHKTALGVVSGNCMASEPPGARKSALTGRPMTRGEKKHNIRIGDVTHTYMQPAWWCSLDDPADDECEFTPEDRAVFAAARKETWQKARKAKVHATVAANEKSDLKLVEDYFFTRYIHAERYAKDETRVEGQRTPDFRLFRDAALAGHCEVKSPQEDTWIDDELAEKAFNEPDRVHVAGGSREDKLAAKIARHIDGAADQFAVVNADRALPNILALVSHDPMATHDDLVEALTGYFYLQDGDKLAVNMRVAKGKIKDKKNAIDLYMWFDATEDGGSREPQMLFFTGSNEQHLDTLCKWLGVKKGQIRTLT